MALLSPGVEITVTNESSYTPGAPGTVAAIVVATAQNKISGSGAGIAAGTLSENAGQTYLIGSQRELTATFGNPLFYTTAAGTPLNGYELNEYGLMAGYSLLGVTNRLYVIRANIDLNELTASTGRPSGTPANGTVWWDVSNNSRWGLFEWNRSLGTFTNRVPLVITSTDDLSMGVPKTAIGAIGQYAVVTTNSNNPVYFKNRENDWVLVGSEDWQNSWPVLQGSIANPTLTTGQSIIINDTTVTLSGTTVENLASAINSANIDGVSADVVNGRLELYATSDSASDGDNADGLLELSNDSGTLLTDTGLTAGLVASPALQMSQHFSVPQWKITDTTPRPTGSVWAKTTSSNLGFFPTVNVYNAAQGVFDSSSVAVYANDETALRFMDTSGGMSIPSNSFYIQNDVNGNSTATFKLFRRHAPGLLSVTGTVTAATPITASDEFSIQASFPGSTNLTSAAAVVTSGTSLESLASDINSANVANVSARVNNSGALVIEHAAGGVIYLEELTGTPLQDAGITTSIASGQVRDGPDGNIILSNWVVATYSAATSVPNANPENNRLWYHSGFVADIMINDGTEWKGYHNVTSDARGYDLSATNETGVLFSSAPPVEQVDGSPLEMGDIWIDTGDLENYPVIYRYQVENSENRWVLIDTSDQTTENGIIFEDARFMGDGTTDVVTGTTTTTTELLTSDYLDLDAPDATIYPRGMLLFNTRRSSGNVKRFQENYFSRANFPDVSEYPVLPTEKDAWVTASGNKSDGTPYMGRKAQRSMIVNAMKSAIDSSVELREDARNFNLIAAPGYPELISNMVQLNNDRRMTGFVIGEAPMRLSANTTEVANWASNATGVNDNGEDGLVTNDEYLGVFYGTGRTNDLSGNQIVVPPSHAILRMITRSDSQSYPWLAPAGVRRGLIDNINSLGYIEANTGRFIPNNVRESLRDTLYMHRVNPIAFFEGAGFLNYGNKTRASTPSSMDRINASRCVAYLRRQIQVIGLSFVHEPNDKITRDEFKLRVEKELNDVTAKRGLYDYLVVCDKTNNTNDRIDRNELHLDAAVEITKSSEFIFVPIRLENTGALSGN